MTDQRGKSGPQSQCVSNPASTASNLQLAWLFISFLLVVAVAHPASAQTLTVLHSFAGATADGALPYGNLLLDANGNLYGTTYHGGSRHRGTVFELTSTGAYQVLYSFGGKIDGANPLGTLTQDSEGNLYGVAFDGGVGHYGTVFKLAPGGVLTVLHSFTGAPDGGLSLGGLVLDAQGNVYGTTIEGGPTSSACPIGCGTVFQVSPTGVEKLVYSFQGGTADGDYPLSGLVIDSQGNLFGTTNQGGAQDGGVVFEVSADGAEKILHDFQAVGDGALPGSNLIRDPQGNFYGTTESGGASLLGTVFEITAGGVESVLYSFSSQYDAYEPAYGVVRDPQGNLYGASRNGGAFNRGAIFKLAPDGTETLLHSFDELAGGRYPGAGLVLDAQGNLYGTTVRGGAFNHGTIFKLAP